MKSDDGEGGGAVERIILDARLGAAAELALEAMEGKQNPVAADIGCDHGYLTAWLLERCAQLRMIASDISRPSLEKAESLLAVRGLRERATLAAADGLSAIDRPVDAVIIAGMGAETILKIVREGAERIGGAALIVQANVDLPLLREGLSALGFPVERELFALAAGRRYVTMLAKRGEPSRLDEREALLGTAKDGARDAGQRAYFLWQRGVRMREMRQAASQRSESARKRMEKNGREIDWIAEALDMKTCLVKDIEAQVGGIAPYELAEPWDNVGLLFGSPDARVERILVALDLTKGVLEEAKAVGAELIVTHHPIMFAARKRITDADREGALMLDMARAGISLIAAHTNLDAAPGGVNDTLIRLMGCQDVRGEGCMRVGELQPGMTLGALAERARQRLHAAVRVYGAENMIVHTLGCCSGAGDGELMNKAIELGADCFITGEMRHHLALDAVSRGVGLLEAGHYETENPVCEVLADALQKACDALEYKVTVFCSKENPFGRLM